MQRIERRAPFAMGKTCAFTGHRPNKYPCLGDETSDGYKKVYGELKRHVDDAIRQGYTHFVCGGALGADTMAARLIIKTRDLNPLITLEIVIPCPEQDRYWSERDKRIYLEILESADILTQINPAYTVFCMAERNKYMVELSDRLIAIYDGTRGGTYMTLKFALDKGIETEVINPKQYI